MALTFLRPERISGSIRGRQSAPVRSMRSSHASASNATATFSVYRGRRGSSRTTPRRVSFEAWRTRCTPRSMRWSLFAFLFFVFLPKDALAWCVARTCNGDQQNCERDEDGCPVGGEYLNWEHMPVQYRFDDHGSERLDTTLARQAIRRAFDTWSHADCEDGRTSLRFQEESDIVQSRRERESGLLVPFAIHFRDEVWPHEGEDNTLAKTTFVNTKRTGYIREVAMEINTSDKKFALTDEDEGDYDLQSVVTHEVGHWIGIAHSNVPGAIMQPNYRQSATR